MVSLAWVTFPCYSPLVTKAECKGDTCEDDHSAKTGRELPLLAGFPQHVLILISHFNECNSIFMFLQVFGLRYICFVRGHA